MSMNKKGREREYQVGFIIDLQKRGWASWEQDKRLLNESSPADLSTYNYTNLYFPRLFRKESLSTRS